MRPQRNYKPGKKDDCQTPGYGIEPIIPWLRNYNFEYIWEPAESEGYLTEALRDKGFRVLNTGLPDNDFFDYEPQIYYDCIVTNPPFSIKHLFLERCRELEKPWFLLMPIDAIGTQRVQKALNYIEPSIPEVGIIVSSSRINFKMPNKGWSGAGAQMNAVWYTNVFVGIDIFDASHWTKKYRERFET